MCAPCKSAFICSSIIHLCWYNSMPCQDIVDAPPAPAPPPPAQRPSGFGQCIRRMQTADPDRPLDPQMETRCMDLEFHNLAHDIDVCTERFMRLQTNMTTALDRYQGCRLVGMDAHMLGRLVHATVDIGFTTSQVEFLHQRLPDLDHMEKSMWEAAQEIEPHLHDLLDSDPEHMLNHVFDKPEENLPITPLLEACRLAQPYDKEVGPVEPTISEFCLHEEFNYLATEIDEVTHNFMRLQTTMTTALERYTKCLLLNDRIYHLEMVVIAAENIGFDSQEKAYIESKIPNLLYMEKVTWEQSLEIKPHLENLYHPDFEMMDSQLPNVE